MTTEITAFNLDPNDSSTCDFQIQLPRKCPICSTAHASSPVCSGYLYGHYGDANLYSMFFCPSCESAFFVSYRVADAYSNYSKTCGNVKRAPSGRIYLFSGMINCPICGRRLSARGGSSIINRKTGAKKVYCYYRCNKAFIDHKCTYKHMVSQNLIEQYLIDHLEYEYNKFKIKCEKIEKEQEKKKKIQTPEKLQKELERLNLLFQKGRIEWDYYSKEYDRIETELNELLNAAPELEPDYAYLEELLNTDFRTMYYNLTQENRRAFWHSIIRKIHLNTDHTVDSVDFL